MEDRRGREGNAGGQRRGVSGALCRGEGFNGGLRLDELGREGAAGEKARESRQDAADRWDGGRATRRGRVVVEVGVNLQAGQLQSRCAEPIGAVWDAVQPAGLQVLLLKWVEAKVLPLEALPPPQKTPVLKHVSAARVQSPETALTGLVRSAGDLDEAVVEGEVVAQGVLPPLRVLPVVREPVHDELVNVTEGEHLLRAALDGHGRQGDVGVRRLLVAVRVPAWARHCSAGPGRTGPG